MVEKKVHSINPKGEDKIMSFTCGVCQESQSPRTKPYYLRTFRKKVFFNYSDQFKKNLLTEGTEIEKEIKICEKCAVKEGVIDERTKEPEGEIQVSGEEDRIRRGEKSKEG